MGRDLLEDASSRQAGSETVWQRHFIFKKLLQGLLLANNMDLRRFINKHFRNFRERVVVFGAHGCAETNRSENDRNG